MPTLDWIGKSKVVNHHLEVPYRVLEHQYSYDKDGYHKENNNSENMIIHGDNLSALKSLLLKYENRVQCIYIDPPYNTGNEGWVYNDNVNDPQIKEWLGNTVGKEDEDLSRHDKWLCMMYPRLKLLKKLLAQTGAIFISIDDTEAGNLRLICDEIFGARNFIADVIWEKSDSPRMDVKMFSTRHDHTFVYAKKIEDVIINRIQMNDVPKHYNKIDDDGRRYYLKPLRAMGQNDAREDRPNLYYPMTAPDGTEVTPKRTDGSDGNWRWSKKKVAENPNLIEWVDGKNGWTPYYRIYADNQSNRPPETIWYNKEVGSNRTSMKELKEVFDNEKVFDTPKPISFIERMIEITCDKNSIILDSFAGSGTTAQAVLNANKKDGGNRKFILVELMDYANSITAERVKRVIDGYGPVDKRVAGTKGSFSFYELGRQLMTDDGMLNNTLDISNIREYVYFMETRCIPKEYLEEPYKLGEKFNTAYYLYYKKEEETVLARAFLKTIKTKAESYVIYADRCLLNDDELTRFNIVYKKIPRDISKM